MKKIFLIIFVLTFLSNQQFAQNLDSLNQSSTSRPVIILYETGMGILTTAGSVIAGSLLSRIIFKPKSLDESLSAAGIVILASLTLGGAYGVHFVDNKYNKNSSYLVALGGSLVGFGASYLLLLNSHQPIGSYEAVFPVIAPLTFSILAVNLINYESLENKISINYEPTIIFNKLSHNINIQLIF